MSDLGTNYLFHLKGLTSVKSNYYESAPVYDNKKCPVFC